MFRAILERELRVGRDRVDQMRIHPIHLPEANEMVHFYINDFDRVRPFYDYPPAQKESYQDRYKALLAEQNRAQRSALIRALHAYNRRVNAHSAVGENIDLLEREDSVVVIGGQQAGVLTGPLYTVYKAITILQLAREQQKKLNAPVIPVFWIAGEDHDLEEVNHLWLPFQLGRLTFGSIIKAINQAKIKG